MTWTDIAAAIQAGGVVLLMAVALVGRFKQWWVDGPTHSQIVADRDAAYAIVVKDRDEWKSLAMRGFQTAEKVATVAKAVVDGHQET